MENTSPNDENESHEFENQIPVPQRLAMRSLAERHATYTEEVRRFIDAGIRLMSESGTLDPRVTEVVSEAGLSNTAFYRHFPSKDDLLLAILADGVHQLLTYLEHQMEKEDSPLGQVRAWVRGILVQAARPSAARATRPFANAERLAELFPAETHESIEALKTPLRDSIEALRESGLAPDADPARDADAVYQLAMGITHHDLLRDIQPTEEDIRHVVAFAVHGILKAGGSEGRDGA